MLRCYCCSDRSPTSVFFQTPPLIIILILAVFWVSPAAQGK